MDNMDKEKYLRDISELKIINKDLKIKNENLEKDIKDLNERYIKSQALVRKYDKCLEEDKDELVLSLAENVTDLLSALSVISFIMCVLLLVFSSMIIVQLGIFWFVFLIVTCGGLAIFSFILSNNNLFYKIVKYHFKEYKLKEINEYEEG